MIDNFLTKKALTLTPYTAGLQPQEPGWVKLNTNENPYPPSPAVHEALENFDLATLRLYPDSDSTILRTAIAEAEGLSPENIFIGNGSDEVLALAFQAFFSGKTNVLTPDISYGFYPVWGNMYDVGFTTIPVCEDFSINTSDYKNAKGVVIANPNAPTSLALGLCEIAKLATQNPNGIVLVDEAYIDFATIESASKLLTPTNVGAGSSRPQAPPSPQPTNQTATDIVGADLVSARACENSNIAEQLNDSTNDMLCGRTQGPPLQCSNCNLLQSDKGCKHKPENLLIIRTFSKSHSLAGMRIGYAIGHPTLIEALRRVRDAFNSYPLDMLAQTAATASIKDTAYLQKTTAHVIQTRDKTATHLRQLGYHVLPSQTNFILIQTPHANDLYNHLLANKILARYWHTPRLRDYLRVTIGTDTEMEAFLKCVQEFTPAQPTKPQ